MSEIGQAILRQSPTPAVTSMAMDAIIMGVIVFALLVLLFLTWGEGR